MAITIPKQPFGITLPIIHGIGGYFNQSFTVLDQLKHNLVNLLLTKKGERRMNPDFGSNLHSVLFEFSNENLPIIVDGIIRKDIDQWMPFITIQSISVDTRTELRDIYVLHVTVKFTADALGIIETQSVDVSIESTIT